MPLCHEREPLAQGGKCGRELLVGQLLDGRRSSSRSPCTHLAYPPKLDSRCVAKFRSCCSWSGSWDELLSTRAVAEAGDGGSATAACLRSEGLRG